MWFQYVTGGFANPATPISLQNLIGPGVDSLLQYEPLQLAAIMEQVWRSRYNARSMPFAPWPEQLTQTILGSPSSANDPWILGYSFPGLTAIPQGQAGFIPPYKQPGFGVTGYPGPPQGKPTIWDHLIFAYLVELTNIERIFGAVMERVAFGEDLGDLTPATRRFFRTTEWLLYGDAFPSSLLTSGSRLGRDDLSNRVTAYYWMFGADLPHGQAAMSYERPVAANRDFFPVFEQFLREVWVGIMDAKNTSGENPTDPTMISILARRLYDMMQTRRLNGQLSREEFSAVAKMSWLFLVLLSNNFVIRDLQCEASDPSERLANIARRVNMKSHLRTKFILDLAQPASFLMQSIEMGMYNTVAGANLLYMLNQIPEQNAEVVINNYSIATNVDLKAKPVASTEFTKPPHARLPAPRPASHANGHFAGAGAP